MRSKHITTLFLLSQIQIIHNINNDLRTLLFNWVLHVENFTFMLTIENLILSIFNIKRLYIPNSINIYDYHDDCILRLFHTLIDYFITQYRHLIYDNILANCRFADEKLKIYYDVIDKINIPCDSYNKVDLLHKILPRDKYPYTNRCTQCSSWIPVIYYDGHVCDKCLKRLSLRDVVRIIYPIELCVSCTSSLPCTIHCKTSSYLDDKIVSYEKHIYTNKCTQCSSWTPNLFVCDRCMEYLSIGEIVRKIYRVELCVSCSSLTCNTGDTTDTSNTSNTNDAASSYFDNNMYICNKCITKLLSKESLNRIMSYFKHKTRYMVRDEFAKYAKSRLS